jgi:uncharacterized coiled-coil DUF342 family protein
MAIVFFIIAGLLWLNQQYVLDQISVWQYHPTSQIAQLADRAGMSSQGRFYFYASQPLIDGTQKFNQECESKEESTAILGCYTANHIYVYDVTDVRLDGIREVTASHEMLHAAYQRLSSSERDTVNGLVEAEYTKLLNDPQFKERMAYYARTEPGERDNELHSIIGTEVRNISSELAAHYQKYFADRSKVLDLHDKYASVFQKIDTQAKQILAELDTLGKSIEAASITYNKEVAALNSDIESFNNRAQTGAFSSQAQFNNERAALSARVTELGQHRDAINNDIQRYETLRTEYNQTASESKQLSDSINSKLAPAPSI